MKEEPLEQHILGTYLTVRYGLVFIAFAFPLTLWIGGQVYGNIGLQGSMSAYYHACNDGRSLRSWFVGTLFAVAACLYVYKGYRRAENIALNCAGLLALGIAVFPMDWTTKTSGVTDDTKVRACLQGVSAITDGTSVNAFMHGLCAISFFLCIAFVCLFCASDTLPLINNKAREDKYRRIYLLTGAAMILSPIAAFLLTQVLGHYSLLTFFTEAFAIYAFAVYWLVKSKEIKQTNAELHAIRGKLTRKVRPRAVVDEVNVVINPAA